MFFLSFESLDKILKKINKQRQNDNWSSVYMYSVWSKWTDREQGSQKAPATGENHCLD